MLSTMHVVEHSSFPAEIYHQFVILLGIFLIKNRAHTQAFSSARLE
jgi:hypothetical protein